MVDYKNHLSIDMITKRGKNGIKHYELNNEGCYIQITSPLRRKVDIINQIYLMNRILEYSFNGEEYLNNWIKNLDKSNERMKIVRQVENHCYLISLLSKENNQEKIYNVEQNGNIKYIVELGKTFYDERDMEKIKIKVIISEEKKKMRVDRIK